MILITGGTGYIGSKLLTYLEGKKVRLLVNDSYANEDFDIAYGDLTDINSLDKALKDIDTVIHLAAATHSKDDEMFNIVNVNGTKNLIESCKKNKVKKIIFMSSMAAKRRFRDAYGESKYKAEELIRNCGLKYTILRPSLIYGKGSLGMKHTVEYIKKIPFFIPIIGSGEAIIQPVYIDDVLKAIVNCVDNDKTNNKEYDLLGGTRISFNYFIDFVSSRINIKKRKLHLPVSFVLMSIGVFNKLSRNIIKKELVKTINDDVNGDNKNAQIDLGIKFKRLSEVVNVI